MSSLSRSDTICAISTPIGRAGIGVVRVSGPQTAEIANKVIGELPEHRRAVFRPFKGADGDSIDEGVVIYARAPNTFTGEDLLELQGHANPVLQTQLLEAIVGLGARIARPGEFTERAFLNDRLDLTQAEAVADLIESSTAQAAKAAMRSLQGDFSNAVLNLDKEVLELRVYVEAAIDFADEDVDALSSPALQKRMASVVSNLNKLIKRVEKGGVLRTGVRCVLTGPPNVGKSSLFNALLGEDRAIVTEIEGTTRDTLDGSIQLNGVEVQLVDTAGLHETEDRVELAGIQRTEKARELADVELWIEDDCSPRTEKPAKESLVVRNKVDLSHGRSGCRSDGTIGVSATKSEGLEALRKAIAEKVGVAATDDLYAGRPRHMRCLRAAQEDLDRAYQLLNIDRVELFAERLQDVQRHLGEIVGETTSDELLGEIFASFCIGK